MSSLLVIFALTFAVASAAPSDVCKLPKEVGPCRGAILRYYFDQQTKTCEEFIFGGCGGNGNKFFTLKACQELCNEDTVQIRQTPVKIIDPADNNIEQQPDFIVDCDEEADPCSQPKEAGNCMAMFLAYHYDEEVGECRQFIYGGCGGNSNRFATLEQCNQRCTEPRKAKICRQPMAVTGNCKGFFERWTFNAKTGECTEFIYTGCDGNANNFETKDDCLAKCKDQKEN